MNSHSERGAVLAGVMNVHKDHWMEGGNRGKDRVEGLSEGTGNVFLVYQVFTQRGWVLITL